MNTFRINKMLTATMCVVVLMLGCTDTDPKESASQSNNTKPEQTNIKIDQLAGAHNIIKQINTELENNPSAAGGKTYYVCDTGNDENTGLSESSPFRSYEKAISMFATISGGDSVLLCRGGQFPITKGKGVNNLNCSVEAPCTLSDYGDATKAKPSIISSDSTAALKFYGNINPAKNGGGYVIKNLNLLSTTGTGKGIFLYVGVHDMLLDNLHIQGFRLGVQLAGTNIHKITLKNSTVINSVGQGVLGGCTDCLYENNYFQNNGANVYHHNIYLSSGSDENSITKNMVVRGNTLYQSALDDEGKCGGVSLVAHGRFEGLTIENNLIKEDVGAVKGTCYGISVDPGYAYDEYFKDVVIRGNTLLNVGGNAIGCASCDGALIENNTIIDEGSVLVHGISVPVRTEDTVKSKNITIRNNKILLTKNWNQTSGVRVGGFHPMSVENNDIYLADYPLSECVRGTDKNIDVDDTLNTCNKTVSASNIKGLVQTLLNDSYKVTPVQETPVQETPVQETPVQETPVQETPVQETPVQETPVQETPVQETPVQETRVQETRVQEILGSQASTENELLTSSIQRNPLQGSVSDNRFVSTTYKAGSLFSISKKGSTNSAPVKPVAPNKTCQVYARGRCMM
ncbi:hypothetical protein [Cycloclasticus pugetii]|uniref:hypothetical protein n=1 Tax=Cycloclasticus pugetii TaxID=34068 RepID=UPI0039E38B2F